MSDFATMADVEYVTRKLADEAKAAEASRRAAWLAARKLGIGGSEVCSIIAPHIAYEPALALWLKKTGRVTEEKSSARMDAGRYHEPAVAAWFADEYQCELEHHGHTSVASGRYPHLRATPDYYVKSPEHGLGVVELKCRFHPGDSEEFSGKEPTLKWQIQVQAQMGVVGCSWGAVAALVVGEHMAWVMKRDDEFISRIGEAVEKWWEAHVIADTPPPVDDSPGVADWLLKYIPAKRDLVVVELDGEAMTAAMKLETLRQARLAAAKAEEAAKDQVITAIGYADAGDAPGLRYLLAQGPKNRVLKLAKESR